MIKHRIDLRLTRYATASSQAWFETISDIHFGDHKIPAGLKTDGASQPRWTILTALMLVLIGGLSSGIAAAAALIFGVCVLSVAYLVPPFGAYTIATFWHDKLLEEVDRHEADRQMKIVLEQLGISGFFKGLLYRIVRANSVLKNSFIGS